MSERPGPIRVESTVSTVGFRWCFGINVVFPRDVLFSPEQVDQASTIMNGYWNMELNERTCRRLEMSLEAWLDGLLAREELIYHYFDREWRPPGT